MTGNRTNELCNGLRDIDNLNELFGINWADDSYWEWHIVAPRRWADDMEQPERVRATVS